MPTATRVLPAAHPTVRSGAQIRQTVTGRHGRLVPPPEQGVVE
jgi:hypothetical protein